MRRRGRRWYVFGAQAVVAYGRPRMTADVDVTVEASDVAGLVRDLEQGGFQLRIPGFEELFAQVRVIPLIHAKTSMPLDVVLAGPGLEEEFLRRARVLDMGGVRVPVISPEDLIATKLIAGRPKDLEDVRGIVLEQGSQLDLDWIQQLLADVEQALGQSDLAPAFEEILSEIGPRRPQPRSKRGRRR